MIRTVSLVLLAACCFPGTGAAKAATHPTVYMTPEDVLRARANVQRYSWARQTAAQIVGEADKWSNKDDSWLRGLVPKAGAAFAYGFTGCPICGASWGTWGAAHASLDDPGHVVCANGHRLPDAAHPDSGTGYVGPDGRIHYFVGSYNAWVVETLTFKAVQSLSYAYSLTGKEIYADKAGVILDALAAVYPLCDKGSWDYPSNPPSGRFNRPWYQVARVLVHYADFYDQIWNSPSLEQPSVKPGLKRRTNIEENLLKNGAEYCRRESLKGTLTNGEADYLRGVLSVGVLFGIPDYVSWAVDGPYGIRTLLDNNIDRDGGYYETSSLYANHTRELYFSFAEPLFNYRGDPYPHGLNLYENSKLREFFELLNLKQNCAGHVPSYGDTHADTSKIVPAARPFDRDDINFLERLYARTANPAEARKLTAMLLWLKGGPSESLEATDRGDVMGGGFDERSWLLFHHRELPAITPALSSDQQRILLKSNFLGQKGIAVLREGSGEQAQALLLRFGPSLNHGHLDDLNINYFANGYEVTYDLGYGLGSTHTQVGWARQTASHNVVVVDETPQLQTGASGGSLLAFADLPALKLVEASSESSYAARHVSLYRRTLALVGTGSHAYLLDIFRVRGGSEHDYGFHALGTHTQFEGVDLGTEEPGSLAGPDIAWGDKQLNDGDMQGVPQRPYWNPPPGNGYGFLMHPRRGKTDSPWSADWEIAPGTHLRLHMANTPGTEVITAIAPGITPSEPKARYVFARRRGAGLRSEFVAAMGPYTSAPFLNKLERLPMTGPESDIPAVAVRVDRQDGTTDYVFSSGDVTPRRSGPIVFAGRFACATVKGEKLIALSLVGTREFSGFGVSMHQRDAWDGVLTAVDPQTDAVTTSARLPDDGSLDGHVIIFNSPRYSRTTAYRIRKIEAAGAQTRIYLNGGIVLGRGKVGRVIDAHTITTSIPHGYAFSVAHTGPSGFFHGKRIRSASGASGIITSMHDGKEITISLDTASSFRPGDLFFYEDLQPADSFEIPVAFSSNPGP